MSAHNWTPQQQDAIRARGGSLLVSAAAGSGKTAVLVERVIERLTDQEHPSDADRLLVVTFTKAAAAEMSERISARLSVLLEEDPFNIRLQRQQILLTRAHISTIHSFCSELIRENFYKLGVSPDFRILDDGEMELLRAEAIDEALDEAYEIRDTAFTDLVEAFSSMRDDKRLTDMVSKLYDFVRSHPFPDRWFREKSAMYRAQTPVSNTQWGKTALAFAKDALQYALSLLNNSLAIIRTDEKIQKAYGEAFEADLTGLKRLLLCAENGEWDSLAAGLTAFSPARLKALRGYADDPLKNKLSAARKEVKAMIERLAALFYGDETVCGEEIHRLAPLVDRLFALTRRFGEILAQKKADRNAADFSDLEHWALRLLVREGENGPEFTPEAFEQQARFDEIMVDEYQDTNEAQDMIFRAVSRSEENLFLVGDVKQSIYSFRQAMPQIFLRRRSVLPVYSRKLDRYPAALTLDRNFRSRSGVTETVNFIFTQLMSEQTGELDYDEGEALVAGASYPPAEGPSARLDIVDLSSADDERGMVEAESRHLAELIQEQIKNGLTITRDGVSQPVRYSDFCILLRSANKWAPVYARELQRLGIPAWSDTSGGFFAAWEVSVALSLLHVVDNPVQDIPLLATLMSPIYGFTPDDLAEIRHEDRRAPLYTAVRRAAEKGNGRAAAFLKEVETFRTLSATLPSDGLIRLIYEKTGFADMARAMPNGELRLSNLRLLLEYARKFESSGYCGISGFLRYLDRLQRQNGDWAAAGGVSENANAVKIMSIHRSKGLEFPVCILAGCSRSFNRERGDVLLHPTLGFGAKLRDSTLGCRMTTLPREAVSLEIERGEMSEELRVLYVAMTRARERLILVTTVKDAVKTLGKLAARLTTEPRIAPYTVRSVSSISDWLLLCALRHPDGGRLRELAGALPGITLPCPEPMDIHLIRPETEAPELDVQPREEFSPDQALAGRLQREMDAPYPYASLRGIQSKIAVSDLASREFSAEYAATARPAFLNAKGMTPAERGTALHAFLQFADYQAAAEYPEKELQRLIDGAFLTKEQGNAVNMRQIAVFFQSDIAKRILKSSRLMREFQFTVEIPARRLKPELTGEAAEEPVVLQGAVDCAFEEKGALVLVDYKTDYVKDETELWSRYRAQLALYADALTRCTGLSVAEYLLYSFCLGRVVRGSI